MEKISKFLKTAKRHLEQGFLLRKQKIFSGNAIRKKMTEDSGIKQSVKLMSKFYLLFLLNKRNNFFANPIHIIYYITLYS